jgi:hypothetical protein
VRFSSSANWDAVRYCISSCGGAEEPAPISARAVEQKRLAVIINKAPDTRDKQRIIPILQTSRNLKANLPEMFYL